MAPWAGWGGETGGKKHRVKDVTREWQAKKNQLRQEPRENDGRRKTYEGVSNLPVAPGCNFNQL
jgi:hypothetical protein